MNYLSTTLLTVTLLAFLPIAIWAETAAPKTWNNRLFIPELEPAPNRHTPLNTSGIFLPPVISHNLKLTPDKGPVLITTATRIKPGVTVTVSPGTAIYAHEFAQLIVEGNLLLQGTSTNPVTIASNEVHPLNQTWGGIIITETGQADINHTKFLNGSPAITCLPNGQANINNTLINFGSMGIFTASNQCPISNTVIANVRDGIIAINTNPQITNTTIIAQHDQIKRINKIFSFEF